jgi:Protein of unknown function (Hypoth_ymh)
LACNGSADLLPHLLPPLFAEKVVPLFRRGDYDVAVLQAFKEVEVAVRKAANVKGAGYADSEIGTTLMRKAFHPDTGPLTDSKKIPAEREADMHLLPRRHPWFSVHQEGSVRRHQRVSRHRKGAIPRSAFERGTAGEG